MCFIVLILCIYSCDYSTSAYDKSEIDKSDVLLVFKSSEDTLLANGSDKTELSIEIPLESNDNFRILLEITNGSFEEGKSELDINFPERLENGQLKRVQRIPVYSKTAPGEIKIVATFDVWKDTLLIHSRRVLPNQIQVNTDKKLVRPFFDSFIKVSATLSNSGSAISSQHPTTFTVIDSVGNELLRFNNIDLVTTIASVSNSKSEVEYLYTPGETTYRGALTAIVSTMSEYGASISDSTAFYVSENSNQN